MPRNIQIRPPGHGKLPYDPTKVLKVDPLSFIGDNPFGNMAEAILFGGLNTFLQIVDYATGLDFLPMAKMLEDAFVGSTLGGPAFNDFTSYLAQQPATDATTGLPTPSTTATGLLSALLRWLTVGFGTLTAGETLLSQMITAAGGSGSTLTDFANLFNVAIGDVTGLATGIAAWLASGGALPISTVLNANQLSGLATGIGTWLTAGGALPSSTALGVGQLSGLATGIGTWLTGGGALPASTALGVGQLSGLATGMSTWLGAGGALPSATTILGSALTSAIALANVPALPTSKITSGTFTSNFLPMLGLMQGSGSNLVPDPSFEYGPAWGAILNANVQISTTRAHTSTHSLKVTGPQAVVISVNDAGGVLLKSRPGEVFRVGGWIWGEAANAGTGQVLFTFNWYAADGVSFVSGTNSVNYATLTKGQWNYVEALQTAPANCYWFYPYFFTPGVPATDVYYLDDILIREETTTQSVIQQLYGAVGNPLTAILQANVPALTGTWGKTIAGSLLTGAINAASSLGAGQLTGLATGIGTWLTAGGALPASTALGAGQLSGLATGIGTWLTGGGALPASTALGVGQLSGLATGIPTWLAAGGALPSASSLGVGQLSGLATGVGTWLTGGGALPSSATAGISQILTLPGQLSTMFSPFNPPHVVSTGQITNTSQNLLRNATFADASSLNSTVYVWDAAKHSATGGSAKVDAAINTNPKPLLSDPIQVAVGDSITAYIWTQWSGLTYTGTPISLALNLYDASNAIITQIPLQSATMTGATSSWVQLNGNYVIPGGSAAVWARLVFSVDATATAGSVWFSDGSFIKPNLLPQNAVAGLTALATQPGAIIDTGVQAIVNNAALINQSLAAFNSQVSNLRDFLGYVTSGAAPHGSVANIASNVDNTVKARAVQKNPFANIDPTVDATFDYSEVWQINPLPTVPATSGVTVMGDINIRDGGNKQAVTWYGYPSGGTFGSITDFRVNVYTVSKTNNVRTLVHSSANLVATVAAGTVPGFNSYNLPSQIACAAGDKLTAEIAILGTGTYNVVGQPVSGQVTFHPNYGFHAMTRASAAAPATMNPPGVGGSPASYSRNVPWIGLSGIQSQTQYTPVIIPFYSSGSFDPTNYQWANNIDIVVCGPGGNGMNGSGYWGGYAGTAGGWAVATLPKSFWGAVTTSVNVTAGGSQTASTITVPGWGTLSGPAGTNGTQVSGTSNLGAPAGGPGDENYDGTTYHGGSGGGPPQAAGEQPGGGGAGGNAPFTVGTNIYGGPGGAGIGYIKVYQ